MVGDLRHTVIAPASMTAQDTGAVLQFGRLSVGGPFCRTHRKRSSPALRQCN